MLLLESDRDPSVWLCGSFIPGSPYTRLVPYGGEAKVAKSLLPAMVSLYVFFLFRTMQMMIIIIGVRIMTATTAEAIIILVVVSSSVSLEEVVGYCNVPAV